MLFPNTWTRGGIDMAMTIPAEIQRTDLLEQLASHATWTRALATRLVRDSAIADDVVQEALIAAVEHPPSDTSHLRAWLGRVVGNVVRMRYRADRRRAQREAANAISAPDSNATPECLLSNLQMHRLLSDLVLAQPEPLRTILLLHFYEGLSSAEIAKRLNTTPGTVRWRLKEGLEHLRDELDRRHHGNRRAWCLAMVPWLGARNSLKALRLSIPPTGLAALLLALAMVAVGIATAVHRAPPLLTPETRSSFDSTSVVAARESHRPEVPAHSLAQPGIDSVRVAGHVTQDGRPVPGAVVELGSVLTDSGLENKPRAFTRSDGSFELGLKEALSYVLFVEAPDHQSGTSMPLDLRNPATRRQAAFLRVVLEPCQHWAFGKVEDSLGGPIPGALVRNGPYAAQTDSDGHYEVCVAGASVLSFEAAGYGATNLVTGYIGQRLEERNRFDAKLSRAATVEGRIVRASDGIPVSGAHVDIHLSSPGLFSPASRTTFSDDDGRFRLNSVAAGRLLLSVSAPGMATEQTPVVVEPGQLLGSVAVQLESAAQLQGIVYAEGKPVEGASVSVHGFARLAQTPESPSHKAITQDDGSFYLASAPQKDAHWLVEGYEVLRSTVTHESSARILIEVRRLPQIRGRVLRNGAPVPQAWVIVTGSFVPPVKTDQEGRFRIIGLAAGQQFLRAQGPDGTSSPLVNVTLQRGESQNSVDILLSCSGTITGVVVDQDGRPLPSIQVLWNLGARNSGPSDAEDAGFQIAGMKDHHAQTATSVDGSFRATGLCEGATYHATVRDFRGVAIKKDLPPAIDYPVVTIDRPETRVQGIRLTVKRTHHDIAGRVVDSDGLPVSDVSIDVAQQAGPPGDIPFLYPGLGIFQIARTGADGNFAVSDLDQGQYVLKAWTSHGAAATVADVRAGTKDLIVRLSQPASISGKLIGFHDRPKVVVDRHVPGIEFIGIGSVSAALAEKLDGDTFRARDLPPGRYLVATLGSREADAQEVELRAGQETSVTLHNPGLGHLSARVIDAATQKPLAGARCNLTSLLMPAGTALATSDEMGNVDFGEVPARSGRAVCMSAAGSGGAEVSLTAGDMARVEIRIRPFR